MPIKKPDKSKKRPTKKSVGKKGSAKKTSAKKSVANKVRAASKKTDNYKYPYRDAYKNYRVGFTARGIDIAERIVSGRQVANTYNIYACERFLYDLTREDLVYRPEMTDDFCEFAESFTLIEGTLAGELIQLTDWQIFCACNIFGFYMHDGTRRFREVYLEMGRKNFKTTFAAIIGLYCLIADGERGAQVFSAATTEEQAMLVFNIGGKMLAKWGQSKHVNVKGKSIIFTDRDNFTNIWRPLTKAFDTQDGLNPNCNLMDEVHAWSNRKLYDKLKTGMGARTNPLTIKITTAGESQSSFCYMQREVAIKAITERSRAYDFLFANIYCAESDDPKDWGKLDQWRMANPSIDVIPSIKRQLMEQWATAKNDEASRAAFARYYLCRWVGGAGRWLNLSQWQNAHGMELEEFVRLVNIKADYCIGLDLGSTSDLCALTLTARFKDGFYCWNFAWIPADRLKGDPNTEKYARWYADGQLKLSGQAAINYYDVYEFIIELRNRCGVNMITIDEWQEKMLGHLLNDEGFDVSTMKKSIANYSPLCKEIERLGIEPDTDGDPRFYHDGSDVFLWCLGNVAVRIDHNENIFPRKEHEKSHDKIDLFDSLANSMARLIDGDDNPPQLELLTWASINATANP